MLDCRTMDPDDVKIAVQFFALEAAYAHYQRRHPRHGDEAAARWAVAHWREFLDTAVDCLVACTAIAENQDIARERLN